MKTNSLRIILYGITIISIALAISTTAIGQSDSRPPMPVEVKNTAPIPVSGSVTVASSPSAPVSVTGTVNVAGQVTVANAANSPLTVRDLNNMARTPIQLSGSCSPSNLDLSCSQIINYTVPTGKLLVIEYVSTRYEGPEGTRGRVVIKTCMATSSFECVSGFDRRARHYLDPTGVIGPLSWSFDTSSAATSQKVLVFGNDKAEINVFGQCHPGTSCAEEFGMKVTISGYLIDNP